MKRIKKVKIFTLIAAFILAVGSIMASKANKKCAGFATVYAFYNAIGFSEFVTLSRGSSYFTTTKNTHGLYVRIYTVDGLTINTQQMRTCLNQDQIGYLRS